MMRNSPFKSLNLEKEKSTRKRREVEMENGNLFPPEGHVSIHTVQQGRQAGGDTEAVYTCLYFCGARRLEESSWADSTELFEIQYCITMDDVFINQISKFDTPGSQFTSLQLQVHRTLVENVTCGVVYKRRTANEQCLICA
jgi:hypothetical protein